MTEPLSVRLGSAADRAAADLNQRAAVRAAADLERLLTNLVLGYAGKTPAPPARATQARPGRALVVNDNYNPDGVKVRDLDYPWAVMIPGRDAEHYRTHAAAFLTAHTLIRKAQRP